VVAPPACSARMISSWVAAAATAHVSAGPRRTSAGRGGRGLALDGQRAPAPSAQGRSGHGDGRRLHTIASPAVAAAIEAIAAISPLLPTESLRHARAGSRLRTARVCYSHLGGTLAVSITRELRASGVIPSSPTPGDANGAMLDHPLITRLCITDLPDPSVPAARLCQDWTEGEAHLAGPLGSVVLAATLEQGRLQRRPRDRALNVTPTGIEHLTELGLWSAESRDSA
jgi:hypothetical protein